MEKILPAGSLAEALELEPAAKQLLGQEVLAEVALEPRLMSRSSFLPPLALQ